MTTAINRQTGEVIELVNGQWVPQLDTAPPPAPVEQPELGMLERIAGSAPVQRAVDLSSGINRGFLGLLDLPGHAAHALIPGKGPEQGMFSQLGEAAGITREPTDATGQVLGRIGQEIGAAAVPAGAALGLARSAPAIARQGGNILRQLGRQTVQAAKAAPLGFAGTEAGLSAVSGAGAAAAQQMAPGSTGAELLGQMAPVLTPYAAAGAARRLLRGGESGRQAIADSIDTFARAGTTPTVGQATGNRLYQAGETISNSLPGGGPVAATGARQAEQIGGRIDQLASGLSARTSAEQAGRTIERGVTGGFIPRFRTEAENLFNRIDRFIPADTPVPVAATKATLDTLTAPIAGADNLSGVLANPKINQIKQAFDLDIGGQPTQALPYEALKQLRSQVGRLLSSSEIISEAPRAQMKQLYGALSEDMKSAATAQGPEALRVFQRANHYYSAGLTRIEDVLERVVSKTNVEDIFTAATRGREGATTVRTVMRSLAPAERDVVAATMLRRLGRANPSAQDDLGEAFSPETFLTNWNRLAPDSRRALFSGSTYRGLHDDLSAIAKTASQIRDGSSVLANPSGTASRSANLLATGAAMAGAYTGNMSAVGLLVAGAVSNNAAARLLTNPKTVRWLATATRIPPQRLPGHLARLSNLGDGDPELEAAIGEYLQATAQGQTAEQSSLGR